MPVPVPRDPRRVRTSGARIFDADARARARLVRDGRFHLTAFAAVRVYGIVSRPRGRPRVLSLPPSDLDDLLDLFIVHSTDSMYVDTRQML